MINKSVIFFFAVLFLSGSLMAQDKKALALFEKGKADFMNRDYDSALDNFKKYLGKDSSITEVYFRMGQIYESKRDVANASHYYRRVIEKDSANKAYTLAFTYLGSRALENHEFEKAKKYLNVSLQNTNKNSIVYQQLTRQLRTCEFGIQAIANPLNIKPQVLPEVLNFKSKQYFPVFTADNSTIFFTARDEQTDENIYYSELKKEGWVSPKSISEQINTPYNEGTCTISADGKIMVFTSCEGRESLGSCDLFITRRTGDSWSTPTNLGPAVNSRSWDSQPSLSSDGNKLYFASERPGGFGRKDIWMSELKPDGTWKTSVNLGPKINTSQDEVSPFIHANGYSFFFSSNGREGMGKFDIYLATTQKDVIGEPVNLGYPINTADDELALFVTADGKKAYYSVDKTGSVKLFEFSIPEQLSVQINKIHYLKGYITDRKTQKPLYSNIELVNLKTNEKVSTFLSDPVTGDYMAVLPSEGEYGIYVSTPDYLFKSLRFKFSKDEDWEGKLLNVELDKIEKELTEVLNNIFFDSGSSVLRDESIPELEKLTELLKKNASVKIEISGHTDDIGNETDNLNLSRMRAQSVIKYLQTKGVGAERLIATGFGETKPLVKNDSEENRQLNRRIELKFL
ncbi:OmpA family protein [Emticicia sp. CRIBPO]|uniref:OmpA family protein n=1 Tax=Emticicia sp. CRIBPO TaxID=2683258 RepID=UPI0014129DED|nr:OmpA family protein [Emticicia sp. CRIBPO]NBA85485.1 OmpA family protein [Emticicia sp. CRIBPO]